MHKYKNAKNIHKYKNTKNTKNTKLHKKIQNYTKKVITNTTCHTWMLSPCVPPDPTLPIWEGDMLPFCLFLPPPRNLARKIYYLFSHYLSRIVSYIIEKYLITMQLFLPHLFLDIKFSLGCTPPLSVTFVF